MPGFARGRLSKGFAPGVKVTTICTGCRMEPAIGVIGLIHNYPQGYISLGVYASNGEFKPFTVGVGDVLGVDGG